MLPIDAGGGIWLLPGRGMWARTSGPPPSATILVNPARASAALISTMERYRSSCCQLSVIMRRRASASSRANSARAARSSRSTMMRVTDSGRGCVALEAGDAEPETAWKDWRRRSAFSARLRMMESSRRRVSTSRKVSVRSVASWGFELLAREVGDGTGLICGDLGSGAVAEGRGSS